jgi:hypothetical protein
MHALSDYYKETWHEIEQWGMMDFLFKMNEMSDKIKELNKSLK